NRMTRRRGQFLDGASVIGTAAVSGGTAVLTTAALAAASHWITAVYSGDATFNSATSVGVTQVVKANTTVALASSANPSTVGQAVTLTASVSPSGATGSVEFLDGASVIGTAAVSGGTAAIAMSTLAG